MSTAPRYPEFRQMSVDQRLKLVEDVWNSIVDDQEQLPLTDQQKAELDRRIESLEAHPERVIPWEQVKRDLRKRA